MISTEYHYRTRMFPIHLLENNDPAIEDFLNDEGVKGYFLTEVQLIGKNHVLFIMERVVNTDDSEDSGGVIPPGTYIKID